MLFWNSKDTLIKDHHQSSLRNPSPYWKDYWWINFMVFVLTSTIVYGIWKLLVKCVLFIYNGNEYETTSINEWNNIDEAGDAFPTSKKTSKDAELETDNLLSGSGAHSVRTAAPPHQNPRDGEDDNIVVDPISGERFHDLTHHGISFYDDNPNSSRGRQRRPRMHSTVAESMASGIGRKQKSENQGSSTPPPPPAFPKLDNSELNRNLQQQSSCGDHDQELPSSQRHVSSRLSTVPEEESSYDSRGQGRSYLVLHQIPGIDHTANVPSKSMLVEQILRVKNVPFLVIYDCTLPNGPWIEDNGHKIVGYEKCIAHIEETYSTSHAPTKKSPIQGEYSSDYTSPKNISASPYSPLTFLDDAFEPQRETHGSHVPMMDDHDHWTDNERRNMDNEGEFLDDNYEDMQEILSDSGHSEGGQFINCSSHGSPQTSGF